MESILPEMIKVIVSFLVKKLSENKSIDTFFSEFTNGTVNWIKSIFLKKEGTEKEIIQNLKEKPESTARRKAVETAIEIGIEDNPKAEQIIQEMFEKIKETKEGGEIINNIINSKQVSIGNITGNLTQNYNNKS